MDLPVRLELWGDGIDTIHYFDMETQRRTEQIQEFTVSPASEILYQPEDLIEKIQKFSAKVRGKKVNEIREKLNHDIDRMEAGLSLMNIDKYYKLLYPDTYITDYLQGLIILSEQSDIHRQAQALTSQIREDTVILYEDGTLCKGLGMNILRYSALQVILEKNAFTSANSYKAVNEFHFIRLSAWNVCKTPLGAVRFTLLLEDLKEYIHDHYKLCLLSVAQKLCQFLSRICRKAEFVVPLQRKILYVRMVQYLSQLKLSYRFSYPDNKTALIVQTRMHSSRKKKSRHKQGMEIQQLSDLHVGGFSRTHHGTELGGFWSIHKLEMERSLQRNYITIQYAGTEKTLCPCYTTDLVSRYIGSSDEGTVRLNKLSPLLNGRKHAKTSEKPFRIWQKNS